MIQNFMGAHTAAPHSVSGGQFVAGLSVQMLNSVPTLEGIEHVLAGQMIDPGNHFLFIPKPLDSKLSPTNCDSVFTANASIVGGTHQFASAIVVMKFDSVPVYGPNMISEADRVSILPFAAGTGTLSGADAHSILVRHPGDDGSRAHYVYAYGLFVIAKDSHPLFGHISARAVSNDRPVFQPNK